MSNELKPCPFCGGTDLVTRGDDKVVGISCQTCGAFGPNHYDSRFSWNTRTQDPDISELVSALEKIANRKKLDGEGWQSEPARMAMTATAALSKFKGEAPDDSARLMYLAQREADGTPREVAETDWKQTIPPDSAWQPDPDVPAKRKS